MSDQPQKQKRNLLKLSEALKRNILRRKNSQKSKYSIKALSQHAQFKVSEKIDSTN